MRSANERLIEVLKKTTGHAVNVADVEIRNVRENDNTDITRNTRCLILSRANGRLTGSMEFYYNRLALDRVFLGQTPVLIYNYGDRVTTQQLAQQLGEQFGLELYADDVNQSGEIYLTELPRTVKLTAKDGHYCVTGSIDVQLANAGTDLMVAMTATALSGLNPPTGDFTRIQACLYSWNWTAQAGFAELLRSLVIGQAIPVAARDYLTELDGVRKWDVSVNPTNANIHMATLQYRGNRDNHPDYGTGMRRDEIAVIRLSDALNTDLAGDLVISLP